MSCLNDENLAALVNGSAEVEQTDAWNRPIDSWECCAARRLRKQRASNQSESPGADPDPDPDATITLTQRTKENCDDLMPDRYSSNL